MLKFAHLFFTAERKVMVKIWETHVTFIKFFRSRLQKKQIQQKVSVCRNTPAVSVKIFLYKVKQKWKTSNINITFHKKKKYIYIYIERRKIR